MCLYAVCIPYASLVGFNHNNMLASVVMLR